MKRRRAIIDGIVGLLAALAVAASLLGFARDRQGATGHAIMVDGTPATIFRSSAAQAPVVLIAHGFAGSQALMQAFAWTIARSGMIAVTFDFLGHGEHPSPLGGSVTEISGATRSLVAQTARMAAEARRIGDGRVALLGHSMASDVIIRLAVAEPDIAATVAISAFSRAATPSGPRNLLLIAGEWEGFLRAEALRLVGQVSGPSPQEGVTYGGFESGDARRFVVAPHVEHVGVLYSAASLAESAIWLKAAFGLAGPAAPPDRAGLWIALLLAGLILAVKPLVRLLPRVASLERGAGLPWRRFWMVLAAPAILTPVALRLWPEALTPSLLTILVADYLAAHFLLYGAIALTALKLAGADLASLHRGICGKRLAVAAIGAAAITTGLLFPALDRFVTAVLPTQGRVFLIIMMLAGTSLHFVASEAATRGPLAARLAPLAWSAAFLASLALAVALDPQRLFFLAIIVPVILPFMLAFGLFARWIHARTGHPLPGAAASAAAFALAIGATFPMLSG